MGAVRVTVKSSSCFVPTVRHNKFAAAATRWAGADPGGGQRNAEVYRALSARSYSNAAHISI